MDAPAVTYEPGMSMRLVRRLRARRLSVRAAIFIGLPVIVASFYFTFVASDQYESVSPFMIQSAEGHQGFGLESLMGALPGSGTVKDTLAVREYILSRDMLRQLDREHNFIAHFQNPDADWWARLASDASYEEAFKYYLTKVSVSYDTVSGMLDLRVKAFAPDKAQVFAEAILHHSEQMVNLMSERTRLDRIAFAKREVQAAETRLSQARKAILELQKEGADINPEQSAMAAMGIRTQLQAELAKSQADLAQARAFMAPNSPQLAGLSERVNALSKQIARENRKLVNPKDQGLNTDIARFESVILEKEFAQAAYQSTLTSLELARADASRQHQYLAKIASPSLADEATHPKRILGVLTVFLLSLALFGIISLLVAAVREHAKI